VALKPNQTDVEMQDGMYLMGYLSGYIDALPTTPPVAYDIPHISNRQKIEVVKTYLENNPGFLTVQMSPSLLILMALIDAFPNKKR
jgi:hypothetical protein